MTIHEVNANVYSHFQMLWHRNGCYTTKWSFTFYVSCGLTSACCLTLLSVLNKVSKTCSISSRLPAIFLGKTTYYRLLRRAKATHWTTLFRATLSRVVNQHSQHSCELNTVETVIVVPSGRRCPAVIVWDFLSKKNWVLLSLVCFLGPAIPYWFFFNVFHRLVNMSLRTKCTVVLCDREEITPLMLLPSVSIISNLPPFNVTCGICVRNIICGPKCVERGYYGQGCDSVVGPNLIDHQWIFPNTSVARKRLSSILSALLSIQLSHPQRWEDNCRICHCCFTQPYFLDIVFGVAVIGYTLLVTKIALQNSFRPHPQQAETQ